ncbi:hypothetical protein QYE76_029796 [Lolium multiflorum]|uniref:SWIM-type domain-containing protein n=1 Tax=Lolium multiflorum TaxID=4521 RepID=A0AAD8VIM0_LOLMU|nr:hypothetical protein QYE76_029796 [Lolium multiflorum]
MPAHPCAIFLLKSTTRKNIDFAVNYGASPTTEQLFKVEGFPGEYEVNIQKLECTCRAWQLSGIPCRHACAVFRHERIKPESIVHKCYSIDAFKAAYGQVIMLCSDPKVWPKMNGPAMRPPKFDKQVGRPSKKRRRSALEEEDGTRLSRHALLAIVVYAILLITTKGSVLDVANMQQLKRNMQQLKRNMQQQLKRLKRNMQQQLKTLKRNMKHHLKRNMHHQLKRILYQYM